MANERGSGVESVEQVPLEEFRKLVLQELDSVHRLAYHLTLSPHEADDLVQETYLRAFKSRSTFHLTEHGPRPWLFKILHNVYRTRMGKQNRAAASGVEDLEDRIASPPETPSDLDWEQVDDRLKKAIDKLPPAYRTVLLLWAVEGFKYREIAQITEVAIGTVMSRLFRARQMLTEEIADLAVERGLMAEPLDADDEMNARG